MSIKLLSASGSVEIVPENIAGTNSVTIPSVSGGELVVANSSGNVGIGTSGSTNGRLTIYETTNARLYLTDATLGTGYGGQVQGLGVGGAGGQISIGVVDNNFYNEGIRVTSQATTVAFYTTSGVNGTTTERARIDSSGHLIVPNGVTLGTAVGTYNAANTLDDYEEGTFTPTIIGTTVAGTGTYSNQIGRYTKVGNRVHTNIILIWSAHTGTGNMRISGLPFTTNSTTNNNHNAASFTTNMTITGQLFAVPLTNSTEISIYAINNGTASLLAIDTAAQVNVTFSYEV